MKRVLLLIPEGITFDGLTQEQQTAIQGIFGQWVMPMIGTVPYDGYQICDAVCKTEFNPALMPAYGFNWPIIGQWIFEDGGLTTITPLDEDALLARLPVTYDDEGNELPKVLRIPHNWAGWPDIL